MNPIETLKTEHNLIARMFTVIKKSIKKIKTSKELDPIFVDLVIDFFETYSHRNHHGKEENILFKHLEEKKLSPEDKKVMETLVNEHNSLSDKVGDLVYAKSRYVRGEKKAMDEVINNLEGLMEFYPKHVQKEDSGFFPKAMEYFSDEEKNQITKEFEEFDKNMIHQRYVSLIGELEKQ